MTFLKTAGIMLAAYVAGVLGLNYTDFSPTYSPPAEPMTKVSATVDGDLQLNTRDVHMVISKKSIQRLATVDGDYRKAYAAYIFKHPMPVGGVEFDTYVTEMLFDCKEKGFDVVQGILFNSKTGDVVAPDKDPSWLFEKGVISKTVGIAELGAVCKASDVPYYHLPNNLYDRTYKEVTLRVR